MNVAVRKAQHVQGLDSASRGTILPSPIDPMPIRDRHRQQSLTRKWSRNAFLGDPAREHAAGHFETMPDCGEDWARWRGLKNLGGKHSVAEVGQTVVRKRFCLDIDSVRRANPKPRVKSGDIGLHQGQRTCRSLGARPRLRIDLFQSRQQCDVSVYKEHPLAPFPKREPKTQWCGGSE